jgi:hypothetical protein
MLSGSASATSGSTRSVGAGASEENGARLRTLVSRSGQDADGHAAGPRAYQRSPFTMS